MSAGLTPSLTAPFTADTLAALLAYTLWVTLMPGTNTLPSSGPASGLRHTGAHLLGLLWGSYLTICLVGVILGALFAAAPVAQTVLRLAASVYMVWLANRLWRAAPMPVVTAFQPARFGEAVLLRLGNPEAWLVATGVVVGFVPAGEHYLERLLATALVFCLAALSGSALWAMRGARLHAWMRAPSHLRRLHRGMAAITAAAAFLFWT